MNLFPPPPGRPEPPDYSGQPACDHPSAELRRKRSAGGALLVRRQCRTCGASVGRTPTKADAKDPDALPPYDEDTPKRWQERYEAFYRQRREAYDSSLASHAARWWMWYDAYLRSPQWAALRKKVLTRDGRQCQWCQSAEATQAHHLTYRRVGREMLFDLVAVCDRCHEAIHADRGDVPLL